MKIRCGLSIRNGGRIFAPTPKLPKSFFSSSVSGWFFSRSMFTLQAHSSGPGGHRYSRVFSCFLDCETEACSPKVVASIKQKPPTAMIEDAGILDHVRVPTIWRHVDAFISSEPCPSKPFLGYGMLNAILLPPATEPHSVAVGVLDDARLADRVLVGRGRVDHDPVMLLPVHGVGRLCVFDNVLHILLFGSPTQV